MKRARGDDMVILGSGTIVAQLAAGLIDEYQLVVVPIALGGGRTLFDGMAEQLRLGLADSRSFDNGNLVQCYHPVA